MEMDLPQSMTPMTHMNLDALITAQFKFNVNIVELLGLSLNPITINKE